MSVENISSASLNISESAPVAEAISNTLPLAVKVVVALLAVGVVACAGKSLCGRSTRPSTPAVPVLPDLSALDISAVIERLTGSSSTQQQAAKNEFARRLQEPTTRPSCLAAAEQGIASEDRGTRRNAAAAFACAFEQDLGFARATQIADTRAKMPHGDSDPQQAAFWLFQKLIPYNQGVQEAFAAARKWQEDGQYGDNSPAAALLHQLHQQGCVEQTVAPSAPAPSARKSMDLPEALRAITSKNETEHPDAQTELRSFFERGEGFTEAMDAAAEAVSTPYGPVHRGGLLLFSTLFDYEQGYPMATGVARDLMKKPDEQISAINNLFFPLVEHGQAYSEAFEAAKEALANQEEEYLRACSIDLLLALFKKEVRCEEITELGKTHPELEAALRSHLRLTEHKGR